MDVHSSKGDYVIILLMFSSVGLVILVILGPLAALVVWLVWQSGRLDKTANWPVTEATIQTIGRVVVNAGRSSYSLDVGDFSYLVNDEYYSGRVRISSSLSTYDDASPRCLVHLTFQVHYNPQKPEEYFVPQVTLKSFLLDQYVESPFANDVDPIDLNIDKI